MSYQPKGKFVTIDPDNPEALGICDYSGIIFMRKDLCRQMEWRGDQLVWTGFYVGQPFVDKPNQQNRTPILPPDPVPVLDPRPPFESQITWDTDDNVFSQDQNTFDSLAGFIIGTPAPPEQVRLSDLQNFIWSQ